MIALPFHYINKYTRDWLRYFIVHLDACSSNFITLCHVIVSNIVCTKFLDMCARSMQKSILAQHTTCWGCGALFGGLL